MPILSDPTDADTDDDGLTDEEEYCLETNPLNFDTDGDKLSDGIEVVNWYDPLDANPDGDTYDDYQEYQKGMNPFKRNLTPDEWTDQFNEGILKGDFIENPTIPQLLGQIAGSIAPGVGTLADVRDTIANISYGHWFMAALSAIGVAPLAGDAIKSSSKAVNFITKNIDKTDEIADLLISVAKKFPDDFAKVIPNSSLDEIAKAFKTNNHMSRSTYVELASILKKAGKKLPTLSDELTELGMSFKKVASNDDIWKIANWKERGLTIDKLLKNNLGRTYPTYDKFTKGADIATSVKSIDPMCKSYQIESKFRGLLNTYKRHLLRGDSKVFFEGEWINIQRKSLELVFPNVPFTKMQKDVLEQFIKDNKNTFDIVITIIE